MRAAALVLMNILALYLLFVFVAGNGGASDSVRNAQQLEILKTDLAENELELETMRKKLSELRTTQGPDLHQLAARGRKAGDMVVFNFVEEPAKQKTQAGPSDYFPFLRIYGSAAILVILLIAGNVALFIAFRRRC